MLYSLHNGLPFLPKSMKIEKNENLFTNLHDKSEDLIHIRNLKQALNRGLFFKRFNWAIKLNQKAWLKPNIDMNIDLKKARKNDFEIDFFNLINNSIFGKTMENVKTHRDIKLTTIENVEN